MREQIKTILDGSFDYDRGSLCFSCPKIEMEARPGGQVEGAFQIYGESGKLLSGQVVSSDMRMECLTPSFAGNGEEISYRFRAKGMAEGECVSGEFLVISSQGEYTLPFEVSIVSPEIESSLGTIKNLFHFTNLAKVDPDEALKIFYSPDFKHIFTDGDAQYYPLYLGMSVCPGNCRNMEEFLIAAGKKQRVEYLLSDSRILLENPGPEELYTLTVTRNGWGYVELKIETEGDFFHTEKNRLGEDDFLGNHCKLPIYIDTDRLHGGKNMGRIMLRAGHREIVIPITVVWHPTSRECCDSTRRRRLVIQFMEYYQAFRMKRMPASAWREETGRLLDGLDTMDGGELSVTLLKAHLLITQERRMEAGLLLEGAAGELACLEEEEPVLQAYYLYLTTLVSEEEGYARQVARQVEKLYKRHKEQWRIAWLLLYLSEEYEKSATRKLLFLEEQFVRGCTSPVLYIEALVLLHANPALLMKLDGFEKQVLYYGARKKYLSADLIAQAVYLIRKGREYSGNMLRLLIACYEMQEDDGILQEICTLLIRGGKVGPEYFPWYEKGTLRNLRITRLYDYYMMSLDLGQERQLPKMVLLYFSYQSNLNYERSAYLYAYIHRNRKEHEDLYISYLQQIERFLPEQIRRGHINRDLAYLYGHALNPALLDETLAGALADLLFAHQVTVEQSELRQVVLCQPMWKGEQMVPLHDRKARVQIYGKDWLILFEDSRGNRYASDISYRMESMPVPDGLSDAIEPLVRGHWLYDLSRCRRNGRWLEISSENVERFRNLWECEELPETYRLEIGVRLLPYYYECDQMQQLDTLLEQFMGHTIPGEMQAEVLHYLVQRGQFSCADELVREFGPYRMSEQVLSRLYSGWLQMKGQLEDFQLTEILRYVFRKDVSTENILEYLGRYDRGSTQELLQLWKASRRQGVEVWKLAERILLQMLFTGTDAKEKMAVFRDYADSPADPDVKAAVLTECAHRYFVRRETIDPAVFREMQYLYQQGEVLPMVCDLAFLQFYAQQPGDLLGKPKEILKKLALELARNEVCLKFSAYYAELDPELARLADKTVIEYRTKLRNKVMIHYRIRNQKDALEEYLAREMYPACKGVYFMALTLFFGESLDYFIEEEQDGAWIRTESGSIRKSDGVTGQEGKYQILNHIAREEALAEESRAEQLLEEYLYKEYMGEQLFKLI